MKIRVNYEIDIFSLVAEIADRQIHTAPQSRSSVTDLLHPIFFHEIWFSIPHLCVEEMNSLRSYTVHNK